MASSPTGQDLERWLRSLPLNEPVAVDGESVYLRMGEEGAELGAYVLRHFTRSELEDALRHGFQGALEFEAGLCISADEDALLLTQWLPRATGWPEAAQPLENLLNQIGMLRATMLPAKPKSHDIPDRAEQRIRTMFAGGTL